MTDFSNLSPDAQRLIVAAAMGEYDHSPPPEIPESIKNEIRMWAESDETIQHIER